jgi:hypothetical protein
MLSGSGAMALPHDSDVKGLHGFTQEDSRIAHGNRHPCGQISKRFKNVRSGLSRMAPGMRRHASILGPFENGPQASRRDSISHKETS